MKTTKKDFERFRVEFLRWVGLFGLTNYECVFLHERLDGNIGAAVSADIEAAMAHVTLGLKKDERPMERTARHEALELLLSEFWLLAQYRYIRHDELEAARHAVVRRLENFLDQQEKV